MVIDEIHLWRLPVTKRLPLFISILIPAAAALVPFLAAQEPYKTPPKEIVDILSAPPTPRVLLSPGGDRLLLIESESMP